MLKKSKVFSLPQSAVIFTAIIFLSLCFSLITEQAKAAQISAPSVIEAREKRDAEGIGGFYLSGLTPANSEVLVYIDGFYSDLAAVNSEDTAADNFYYQINELLSAGKHTIKVLARDKSSLVLSPPTEVEFIIPSLPAPTLLRPDENFITGKPKPSIIGLTVSNSIVHIFIDGTYNGKTSLLKHNSGTANFAYQPFLNLSIGWHTAWAVTENKFGHQSGISNVLTFKVEAPMPAPTMYQAVVNRQTDVSQPLIVGLAKNDSLIKVYIDKSYDGEFLVENDSSGTANFAYESYKKLNRGDYLVYTTATDKRGKESSWSNIIYFSLKTPEITPLAQDEKSETVAKIEEPKIVPDEDEFSGQSESEPPKESVKIPELKPEEAEPTKEDFNQGIAVLTEGRSDEGIADEEIKKLLEKEEAEENKSGLIDEGEKGQSKIGLNLVIFLAFLLGVIFWIFWVNKELIKERRKVQVEVDKSLIDQKIESDKEGSNEDKDNKQGSIF